MEPDAAILAAKLRDGGPAICSPLAVWETIAALCKNYKYSPILARSTVDDLLKLLLIRYVAIGQQESELAYVAYEKFGKGRHKAALNMGDCFAYACAKANGAKLLFKGGDFALTDIAAA
jgi:ribonuclease VapC